MLHAFKYAYHIQSSNNLLLREAFIFYKFMQNDTCKIVGCHIGSVCFMKVEIV